MKIIINTATTFRGGGVQVALSFIEECRKYKEHQYYVILSEKLSESIDEANYSENFRFYKIPYRPAERVFSFKDPGEFIDELEKKISPDVVFTTTGPAYWRPKARHVVGYNLPHYIYPDSPYFKKISLFKRFKWYLKGKVINYYFKRDSDHYVVQTDDVNRRLRTWLDKKNVHTVTNTCSAHYLTPKVLENRLPEKKDDEFRFLTLSFMYAHKNLELIPEIVSKLPDELRETITFVVTLPESDFQRHFPTECRDCVVNTGPVKPEEGPSLYKECDALFLPTLLECFSASYPEAMAMEKPILTTDLGFARSICGDAALYFTPCNAEDAIKKARELIEDQEVRRKLVDAGSKQLKTFDTPEERAKKYLSICEGLISD